MYSKSKKPIKNDRELTFKQKVAEYNYEWHLRVIKLVVIYFLIMVLISIAIWCSWVYFSNIIRPPYFYKEADLNSIDQYDIIKFQEASRFTKGKSLFQQTLTTHIYINLIKI